MFSISNFQILETAAFTRITTCTKQERYFRIEATYITQISIEESVNTSFVNIAFVVLCFSLEPISQGMSKNNQTKSKTMPKFKWNWNMHQLENLPERNCCSDCHNKIRKTNYNLQLLALECAFHNFCQLAYLLFLSF